MTKGRSLIPGQDFRLLPTAMAALAGARCGITYWDRWAEINTYVLGISAGVLFTFFVYVASYLLSCERKIVPHLLLVCAVATISTVTAFFHSLDAHPILPSQLMGAAINVEGEVITRVDKEKDTEQCSVDINALTVKEERKVNDMHGVRIKVRGVPCTLLQGQHVRVVGKKKEAEKQEKYALVLYSRHTTVIRKEGSLSARFVSTIDNALEGKSEHLRALVPGVALGKTTGLSHGLYEAMKNSQLLHLTAVSGGHVSILVGLTIIIVGLRNRVLTALVSLVLLYVLTIVVGPEPSVVRAAVMAVLVCCGLGYGRSTQALPALCFTLIVVAFIDPWLVNNYGFLLSSSATLGIIVIGEPLSSHIANHLPERLDTHAHMMGQVLGIPLAAQIACIPVLALFTDTGSLWGVAANVLVAPVVAPLTVCGLAAAMIAPVSITCARLFLIPSGMSTWWISSVARHIDTLPGSEIPLGLATLSCLVLLLFLCLNVRRSIGCMSIALALVSLMPRKDLINQQWVAIQCDVGQGSAFVARVKNKTIMIDTGPPEGKVGECLRKADITHIDLLIITHAHADHVGGVPEVFSQAKVDEIWTSPNMSPTNNWEQIEKKYPDMVAATKKVHVGEQEEGIEVLWPRARVQGGEAYANEESLAVYLDILGGVLVMGDQGKNAQEHMKEKMKKTRFLVVAHHGSADQSADFAQQLSPAFALISVGENTYGHPSRRIFNLYSNAQVYTTQQCGTLVLTQEKVESSCVRND